MSYDTANKNQSKTAKQKIQQKQNHKTAKLQKTKQIEKTI